MYVSLLLWTSFRLLVWGKALKTNSLKDAKNALLHFFKHFFWIIMKEEYLEGGLGEGGGGRSTDTIKDTYTLVTH
jgi:hypothetical protein